MGQKFQQDVFRVVLDDVLMDKMENWLKVSPAASSPLHTPQKC